MSMKGKHALITGSSRGIGRGIALKLAEKGAKIAVHYYQNQSAAQATLSKIRELGSDGFLIQADVCRPDEVTRIFKQVRAEFGALDIFVSNARTEAPTFYEPPMQISLEKWDTACDSQAKAFLVGVRGAVPLMREGGRIIAITYAPGRPLWELAALGGHGRREGSSGSLGALLRRCAGAPGNHREHHQSGLDRGQRAQQPAGGGPGCDPELAQRRLDPHGAHWDAGRYRQRSLPALFGRGELDNRSAY